MDAPRPSDGMPLPRGKIITCPRAALSFAASHDGAGDGASPTQSRTHVDEKPSNGCDPVLLEVYKLAMLQSQHYLHTGTTPQREVLGLSWGLLALLCKNSGLVSGTDITNLLLRKCVETNELEACRSFANPNEGRSHLTSLLISGKIKEAIACHYALTLNSLERRGSSDHVMSRFINDLDHFDLMKTYYQVRLGQIPAAATACGEDSCGNWRLHLAIIISMSNSHSVLKEAIAKMAETLASRGQMFAAHFCRMVLQVDLDLFPKMPLNSLVGEWMGLLAEMQEEVRQTPSVASAQRPVDPKKKKVPLSREEFRKVIGPLLPPARCVPKSEKALAGVTQTLTVTSGQQPAHPVDCGPKDDSAHAELQESTHLPQSNTKTLKRGTAKKWFKKMSWLSCFGSKTMD